MTNNQLDSLRKEFLQGDSVLLGEIFKQHGQYCIDMLIKTRGCSSFDAEDIFVESILNFREKIITRNLTELTHLRSYLWGTCKNMHRRLLENEKKKIENLKQYRLLFDEKKDIHLEKGFEEKKHEICQTALAGLTEKCQKVLSLYYVMNLKMEEVAKEMGYSNADVAKSTKKRCYDKWIENAKKLTSELFKLKN